MTARTIPEAAAEWRDIPGWEGHYQASDSGDVRSFRRYADGRLIRCSINRQGYHKIRLCRPGCRPFEISSHRAVALAFIPNPEGKPEVNHIDHNKANNHVSNLEWVTPKENALKASAAGALKGRRLRAYQPLFNDAPKPCERCGVEMRRTPGSMSTRAFQQKRFCGSACSIAARHVRQ